MVSPRPIRPDGSSRIIRIPAIAMTGSSNADPTPNSSSSASLM